MKITAFFLFLQFFVFSADAQHATFLVSDIFHPHTINPSLRLDQDTIELKYFGNFSNKEDRLFAWGLPSHLVSGDYLFSSLNTVVGFETSYSNIKNNLTGTYNGIDIYNYRFELQDFHASIFTNTPVYKNLYAGAEFEFSSNSIKTYYTDVDPDSLYFSRKEQEYNVTAGISWLPENFILAIGLHEILSNNLRVSLTAGYRNSWSAVGFLGLITYSEDFIYFPSILRVNTRLTFIDKIDVGFSYQRATPGLVRLHKGYGVSAGVRLINSSLHLGFGFNDYKNLRLYSPYVIYSF